MTTTSNFRSTKHYYGDIVRGLFLLAAFLMLVGLPIVVEYVKIPTSLSVLGVLFLGIAAGFTNPKKISSAWVNGLISVVGFFIFESYAVYSYRQSSADDKFFLINFALGLVFLAAVYFSVKTIRGLTLSEDE